MIEFCVALFGLFSLLSAFSTNLEMLVILRFHRSGIGRAMPNTITMTSEYSVHHAAGVSDPDVLRFHAWLGAGGVVSAQLVAHIGWHGILALAGSCRCCWLSRCCGCLPESPAGRCAADCRRRPSPERSGAITGERYPDTHFWLDEPAAGPKGSIGQLFVGRQLAITLMLWVVFFASLLIIYLLSRMPTLLNHRGIDLSACSWVTAAFQIGGTMGALPLGVLMDRFNPFRAGAELLSGRAEHRDDWFGENGLWLMALAIFGTGIGVSGSQVGLNALTATLYPTQSQPPASAGPMPSVAARYRRLLSGGMMMAMNLFQYVVFTLLRFRLRSARDAYPADAGGPPLWIGTRRAASTGIVNK